MVNVVILSLEAVYLYIPTIWIVFGFILWEGIIAGLAYVNTFYRIAHEVCVPVIQVISEYSHLVNLSKFTIIYDVVSKYMI